MKFLKALILSLVLLSFSANALLEVSIIMSKEELFPVVIAPFPVFSDDYEIIEDAQIGVEIANIIQLNNVLDKLKGLPYIVSASRY